MYKAFYGFHEKPFSLNPDPAFLYQSKKHQTALNLLEYALLNQASFSVITGEIGTGKTTLIRSLLNEMDQSFTVGLLNNTKFESPGELLQWILMALGLDYQGKEKVRLYQMLYDFLIQEYSQRRHVVLIIDEAQNLLPAALEELRMISNINVDEHQVLQMILLGQESLRETLRRPDLKQFAQRIAVSYHLDPLDRKDTHAYILHRLEVAGGSICRKIFNLEACDRIFQYTDGIPRLINILSDTALVYGFAEQKKIIDDKLVDDVVADKKEEGIFNLMQGGKPLDEMELDDLYLIHSAIKADKAEYQRIDQELPQFSAVGHRAVTEESFAPEKTSSQTSQNIPVLQPEDLSNETSVRKLKRYRQITLLLGGCLIGATLLFAYNIGRTYLQEAKDQPALNKLAPSESLPLSESKGSISESSKPLAADGIQDEVPSELNNDQPEPIQLDKQADKSIESIASPKQNETVVKQESSILEDTKTALSNKEERAADEADVLTSNEAEEPVNAGADVTENTEKTRDNVDIQRVTVKKGDILSKIIHQYYHRFDRALLAEVLKLNPHIENPNFIDEGTVIKLPDRTGQQTS